jgi:hypothetical protein
VEALREVAALGGFFAVETAPEGGAWRAFDDLAEPRVLAGLVEQSRAYLQDRSGGVVEARVAASLHFLGTAARLLSPVLASTVRHAVTPRLAGRSVRWRVADHGTVAFAITGDGTATLAEAVAALDPLGRTVAREFRLSPRIVRGNVASALAGAARMLGAPAPAVAAPLVADAGAWTAGTFRRASCCLFYRVPGGGLCGDCVLRERPSG